MSKLIVDDLRVLNLPGDVQYARNVDDALDALSLRDTWEEVWLDHDLGHKTGEYEDIWPVIALIESRKRYEPIKIGQIFIITSNPVGAQRMKLALDRIGYSTTILDPKPYLAAVLPW